MLFISRFAYTEYVQVWEQKDITSPTRFNYLPEPNPLKQYICKKYVRIIMYKGNCLIQLNCTNSAHCHMQSIVFFRIAKEKTKGCYHWNAFCSEMMKFWFHPKLCSLHFSRNFLCLFVKKCVHFCTILSTHLFIRRIISSSIKLRVCHKMFIIFAS